MWDRIISDYIVGYSDKIKKTTAPLIDRFNISHFQYRRIDDKGCCILLGDRPDWIENYVSEKFFKHDPYLKHPTAYQTGMCLTESNKSNDYKKIHNSNIDLFGFDITLLIIERHVHYVEFYGFSGNKSNCGLANISMNYHTLLKEFGTYFKKELNRAITQMSNDSFSITDLGGKNNNFNNSQSLSFELDSSSHHLFLNDIGFKALVLRRQSLTPREVECLKLLLLGKSSKEIAFILKLSTRTVEFYFENIKNKLLCYSKYELFSSATTLRNLCLL
jgi:DNA-binding CsgD family transcriptional regulator